MRRSVATLLAVALVFGSVASLRLAAQTGESNPKDQIRVASQAVLKLPSNFIAIPPTIRGLNEVIVQLPKKQLAHIQVTSEKRRNEEEAIRRLLEVAQEAGGKRSFLEICGWPALERQYKVKLAQVMANLPKELPEPPVVEAATIAIAQGDTLLRFEVRLPPGAGAEGTATIFRTLRTIHCAANPTAGSTKARIEKLKQMLAQNPYGVEPPKPLEPLPAPVPRHQEVTEERRLVGARADLETSLGSSTSEIQIATSKDGKTVVVGSNSGTSVSNDYGGSFAATITPSFSLGDPTLGTGASGFFYRAGIDVNSTGCNLPVAISSSPSGGPFTFTGNAFSCSLMGYACFPDQPQMAADFRNSSLDGDQLYVVFRRFDSNWAFGGGGCNGIVLNSNIPVIACSTNNGVTWATQNTVGSGDFGRITVGTDGFVYVSFVVGDIFGNHHLLLNKFSSCDHGLNQVPGFPVTVAPFTGVDCPVAGLERCNQFAMSSPQPALLTDFPNHVFIAYAEKSSSTNDDIVVRHSSDGGLTWPDRFVANCTTAARRFMPWVCAGNNTAKVSWYDRRAVTAMDNTLTDYFVNSISVSGPASEMMVTTAPGLSRIGNESCLSGLHSVWRL